MSKNYYVYIIPPKGAIIAERDPTESGWQINKQYTDSPELYTYYFDEYKKQITDKTGCKWIIVFRKYKQLGGFSFAISRSSVTDNESFAISYPNIASKATSNEDCSEDIDEIFKMYLKECGIIKFGQYGKFILKIFKNEAELMHETKEFNCFYLEEFRGSILQINDGTCIRLSLNFDPSFAEQICNNIIILLCLSEIAFPIISIFLTEKRTEGYQREVIKSFWAFKSYLLKCPASQIFPVLFQNKISIINNLLDYRQNDLLDQHKEAISIQNKTLKKIHKADKGILYLTTLVILEVLISVSEIIQEDLNKSVIILFITFLIYVLLWDEFLRGEEDSSDAILDRDEGSPHKQIHQA